VSRPRAWEFRGSSFQIDFSAFGAGHEPRIDSGSGPRPRLLPTCIASLSCGALISEPEDDIKGYWGAVEVREGDDWKIEMDTYNLTPASVMPPVLKVLSVMPLIETLVEFWL
jgi:hypothetical protein